MNIHDFVEYLGLERPYSIQLKSTTHKKYCAVYAAQYTKTRKLSHVIRVYMGTLKYDVRTLETIIAHELIHAWQEEKGLSEIHGPEFRRMARLMSAKFNIPNIYQAETDTEESAK